MTSPYLFSKDLKTISPQFKIQLDTNLRAIYIMHDLRHKRGNEKIAAIFSIYNKAKKRRDP
jgi:hypothetical protein